jgi:hypothetical protein
VALNWLRAKPGVIPVVGATRGEQARGCAASLAWELTADEVARIDALSADLEGPVDDRVTRSRSLSLPPGRLSLRGSGSLSLVSPPLSLRDYETLSV